MLYLEYTKNWYVLKIKNCGDSMLMSEKRNLVVSEIGGNIRPQAYSKRAIDRKWPIILRTIDTISINDLVC